MRAFCVILGTGNTKPTEYAVQGCGRCAVRSGARCGARKFCAPDHATPVEGSCGEWSLLSQGPDKDAQQSPRGDAGSVCPFAIRVTPRKALSPHPGYCCVAHCLVVCDNLLGGYIVLLEINMPIPDCEHKSSKDGLGAKCPAQTCQWGTYIGGGLPGGQPACDTDDLSSHDNCTRGYAPVRNGYPDSYW